MKGLRVSGGPTLCKRETKLERFIRDHPTPAPFLYLTAYSLKDSEKKEMTACCLWQEAFNIHSNAKMGYKYVMMEGGQYEKGLKEMNQC